MMSTTPSDPPGPGDTLPDPPEPVDATDDEPPPDDDPPRRLQGYLARFGYRGGDPRDGAAPPDDPEA